MEIRDKYSESDFLKSAKIHTGKKLYSFGFWQLTLCGVSAMMMMLGIVFIMGLVTPKPSKAELYPAERLRVYSYFRKKKSEVTVEEAKMYMDSAAMYFDTDEKYYQRMSRAYQRLRAERDSLPQ